MFPTAHYGNPGSYAGFTSVDCRKSRFQERTKAWQAPGQVRPACHALVYLIYSKENMYKTTALKNKCRIFVHIRKE